ncbi:amino acid adenylation domain-containing protein [Jeongeupia wiesaeckerbachi]|uniref:amino acid adenylation domain-containing protein n=1 Tax=Jeongeupia wiesaeckerbachi TaxID=3051218 RepID=UPI003D80481D
MTKPAPQLQRDEITGLSPPPAFLPVHRQLSAQAAIRGDALALLSSGGDLRWAELEARANQLAHRLIAAGVGAEVRVGVSVERGVGMIVALLAVLKAGGAFVPLDPGYPAERLGYMLADAGIAHLLTQSALAGRFARPGLGVLRIDDESLAKEPAHDPAVTIHPDQAAYLIYTSGSTGQPKGVTVAHGPLARHCAAIAQRYQLSDADRVLHFASINFDLAHEYWLMPLMAGASLLISDPALWSPAEMINRLARHQVSVAAFPPSYLVQVAEAQRSSATPARLRVLAFGGEALSAEGFAAVRSAFPTTTLINGYGPTETVISPMLWITGPDADPASWAGCAYLPIGTVVGARSAHVLDDALNPLPVGVTGELYLGGDGVARGYHARAGLSAERFIPDPFGAPGSRLYRTGDLARWRTDGAIDYLGRADHQIKLRGLRIELGEIEAQLLRAPGVREAVVWVQGMDAHQRLVGYLVAQHGTDLDLAAIKAQLAEQLPDYMVPSQWLVLDALPVNGAGKVDRKALPVPEWQGKPYRAPEGELETQLASIWAEVLKLDRVGRDDHFFELGGHSLLATQALAQLKARFAIETSLAVFFTSPILSEMAEILAEGAAGAEAAEAQDLFDMDALLKALEN